MIVKLQRISGRFWFSYLLTKTFEFQHDCAIETKHPLYSGLSKSGSVSKGKEEAWQFDNCQGKKVKRTHILSAAFSRVQKCA
jgi:hypothetical protein